MADSAKGMLDKLLCLGGPLTPEDAQASLKLSLLLYDLQLHLCRQYVQAQSGPPLLISYTVDPTSIALTTSHSAKEQGQSVTRRGKELQELLMQRLVFKSAGTEMPIPKILVGYPLALSRGKTAQHIFSSASAFVPHPRDWHHQGFSIVHICADGALLSALSSLMEARKNLYHSPEGGHVPEDERELADLQSLFVTSPCAAHGIQNSLKWAVAPHCSAETLKALHITIESLRNSFTLLHNHLYTFISTKLVFRSGPHDEEEATRLWAAMGIEADVLSKFAEVHPLWDGQHLWVSSHLDGADDVLAQVSFLMLKAFRWQRFTQTRFLSLGSSTRSLVASLLVGLDALVAITRSDPSASDYHLHGYAGFSGPCRCLAVECALASYPAEASLELLLQDDRLALQVCDHREAMLEEWMWMLSLSSSTWRCIAVSAALPISWSEMRSRCLQAALTSLGYVYAHVLRLFEQEPWKWTQGDAAKNVLMLQEASEEWSHPVSQQLQTYLQMGGDGAKVQDLLSLMKECSFSTIGVEQQHGSYAALHRLHPEYGLKTLSTRGYLHSCRGLFARPEPTAAMQRVEQQLEKLERKQPHKVGGRSMFLQDMLVKESQPVSVDTNLSDEASGSTSAVRQQQRLRQADLLWKTLTAKERQHFDKAATDYSALQRAALEDLKGELQERRRLTKLRAEQSTAHSETRNMLSSASLTSQEQEQLWQAYEKRLSQTSKFEDRFRGLQEPPSVPSEVELASLKRHWPAKSVSDKVIAPRWLKHVAAQREYFQHAVFLRCAAVGQPAYLLLYAKRSPLQAAVLEILIDDAGPCFLDSDQNTQPGPISFSCWSFRMPEEMRFTLMSASMFEEGPTFFVANVFWDQGRLHSFEQCQEIGTWTIRYGVHISKQHQDDKERKPKVRKELRHHLEDHPWIADYLSTPSSSSSHQTPGSSNPSQAAQSSRLPVAALEDEDVDQIWADLSARRAAWRGQEGEQMLHFTTQIRGGRWTKLNLGTEADCVAASASKGEATRFCLTYSLPRMSSYSFAKYGEPQAMLMAQEWCRRMEHFFGVYLEGGENFKFDPERDPPYQCTPAWTQFVDGLQAGSVLCACCVVLRLGRFADVCRGGPLIVTLKKKGFPPGCLRGVCPLIVSLKK